MSIESTLQQRSNNTCELCSSTTDLTVYAVAPKTGDHSDDCVLTCGTCTEQLNGDADLNMTHWRCLNDSMWSTVPAVQVLAFQQLTILTQAGETWAQDLLDMMYLEDDAKAWGESGIAHRTAGGDSEAIDSNGTKLAAGDNVYLIKDLQVKGAGFTAKQGTTVRGISLTSNPDHIEGRVNGQKIVILTKFVKKV
ncbi:PhnA domain-containing protein [Psychrosphaera sp. B3R10]|uniref:PhnA domain-containing protein n=1 Tax=Psychrosphaera algicola TaxID=3023714 RepID=A0ABT5FFY8_9GAMM|nr:MULTISPECIES: alkylphosphonate utilization protein [unclassified Psychrosphaera]MBU2882420.1 PhnA domain-containing protein [Psychrosphaera sp. I2R16]MBU2990239.1 PhnA domain-containing protein [Psychrosphaera sp. B3R10]MDC2890470.1 PhnA domain-containing protein [Psychrosphaera sp. G1-22]MDO6721025.1 PhnA domain-containing protein [Psychrosphaera sp. 1_MG-2023]